MTRLIDADPFEVYGTTVPDGMDAEAYMAGACEVLEKIDAMPTVDAVPVEWMENIKCKPDEAYAIRKMLDDWAERKEE